MNNNSPSALAATSSWRRVVARSNSPPADDSGARSHPRNHPATDRAETALPEAVFSRHTIGASHLRAPPRPLNRDLDGPSQHTPTTVTVTIGRPPRGRAITFPAASTITHGRSCHNDSHARSNAARWKGIRVEHPGLVDQRHQRISHFCTRTCGTDDAHSDRHRCSPRHTHAPSNTLSSPGWARSDHWRSPAPARPPHSSATTPE